MTNKIRILLSTLVFLSITLALNAQTWRQSQIDSAHTARNITYITDLEKEVILYTNLCRLFPQDFLKYELEKYETDELYPEDYKASFKKYKASLITELKQLKPLSALQFDSLLYADAKCYANEIATNFRNPHERKICPKSKYAECISFLINKGKDIAIELLIDTDVPGLGHRKNLLDEQLNKIGVKHSTHYQHEYCTVLTLYF